ncbi:glycoside hydrolase family 78 protein [Polaribacter aquimarinus]|uniref:alpha-L-rhamnosidase n=1 Tax=Polaribacter aquimarinus TaxID=2100726 RepID=A0A2U2JEF5_9FLAO|nr:glycoside hydrolase family 78 protein [Polaribacter aquimarinus]PWG06716.1 rhamnosidase [Polaribacter aquimarinus]
MYIISSNRLATVILAILFLVSCSSVQNTIPPQELVVSEQFKNPIGFYDATPSFSWKLPQDKNIKKQTAYSIVVASKPELLPNNADLWESGKVESQQTLFVKYKGKKLSSRQKVYWQLKFWDQDKKASAWSEVANFELGLLHNSDWQAKWISLPKVDKAKSPKTNKTSYKVQYLRNEFTLDSKIESARLYITAKGLFEAELNGKKVGDDVMAPGWTPYNKRIETLTYDVTDHLQDGSNAIGIALAEGWYAGRLMLRGYPKVSPKVMCQLEVKYTNGDVKTFITDESWKASQEGAIVYAGIYDGEQYDARKEQKSWSLTSFDDANWQKVVAEDIDTQISLTPKRHNTVKSVEELAPIAITEIDKGVVIFDMGQNMVGVPRIKVPMDKDGTLKIRFAEMLQQDGRMYTKNYRGAVSTDYYTAKEDGQIEYQPTFTFHGFRYVELSGFDANATTDKSWVTGVVQHSNYDLNVEFNSSHEKLNQLQSNIIWGLRGNTLDIPTDCPQRDERAGWTGDAQVIAPTSFFLGDVHSFWMSWLQSVRDDQDEDGAVPVMVPSLGGRLRAGAGWSDVITIVPWETYQRTGDVGVLEENYASMKKWVGFYQSNAKDHIVKMFTHGDWLQPYSTHKRDERFGVTSNKLIITAHYAHSVNLTAQAAKVLGFKSEAKEYELLFHAICDVFQNSFFDTQGRIIEGPETQTAYLLALAFDLLDDELVQKAVPHLLEQIKLTDNHLRTGFLGTPLLPLVLDKIGETDLMYEILFKETYPSWFYSINQGATTMWERWNSYTHKDGFNKGGMNSFNHYAYGAIGRWMYERIAGIKPVKVGYKEIEIAPIPGGPLTSAAATYNSPYGKVSSSWKLVGKQFNLDIIVPPNTTAQVFVPGNTQESIKVNGVEFESNSDIKLLRKTNKAFVFQVNPGTYSFKAKY